MLRLSKLVDIAERQPGKVAIVDGARRTTYAELVQQVDALSRYLAPLNAKRGAFLARNSSELIAVQGAFATLGLSFVGLDYTKALEFNVNALSELDAGVLVFDAEFSRESTALASLSGVVLYNLQTLICQALQAPAGTLAITTPLFESIAFTSGTTGPPKATLRTKSFDDRRFSTLTRLFGFGPADTFIAALPFYHVSALGWTRLFFSHGATIAVANSDAPEHLLSAMREARTTCALAVPHVVQALLDSVQDLGVKPPLRLLVTGGRHLPRDLALRASALLGPILSEYYGTTETGLNAIATPGDLRSHPSSAGVILEGNDIIAVDAGLRPLPEGVVGTLAICSYQNMDRYLNGRECIRMEHDGRLYLVTADQGLVRDGRVYLHNRGFGASSTIDAYGVEDDLRSLAHVTDAFVLLTEEDQLQVFVVGSSDTRAIQAALQRRGHRGAHVHHVQTIPYGPTGKVQVDLLRSGTSATWRKTANKETP
jgi:acyl-CoA synthetase (AMP-forming)/AMP-acid ligase II